MYVLIKDISFYSRRLAASNRAESQRSISNPVSSLGPNMGSTQSQNNPIIQHQHSHIPSNSTSISPSTNTLTLSQTQTTHPSSPCSSQAHNTSPSQPPSATTPQANATSTTCSRPPPQHRTLNRSISRKDQIKK